MSAPLVPLLIGVLCFLTALWGVYLTNLRALRAAESHAPPSGHPSVSILVPARDEAENLPACLASLLAQDYPNFEILALDDQSRDSTWAVLSDWDSQHPGLHALAGLPLPAGWLGKNWACYQLAQTARGEYLLFTDADTRHHPQTLRETVGALMDERGDLLTGLPHHEAVTWIEKLLVPMISWSLLHFLPVHLAHQVQMPALSAGIGQFMLFRASTYRRIGGHAAVRGHAAEDMALTRRVKAAGGRWRMADLRRRVRCRMYRTGREILEGFSKNLFAAFDYRRLPFLFIWSWLGVFYLLPPALTMAGWLGVSISHLAMDLASVAWLGTALLWWNFYALIGQPRWLALLYPVTMMAMIAIAIRSYLMTRAGRATWKGRLLPKREMY